MKKMSGYGSIAIQYDRRKSNHSEKISNRDNNDETANCRRL